MGKQIDWDKSNIKEPLKELWILRVVRELEYPDGRIVRQVIWEKAEENVSLGSWNEPRNTDIIRFEYREPESENPLDFFRRFK